MFLYFGSINNCVVFFKLMAVLMTVVFFKYA